MATRKGGDMIAGLPVRAREPPGISGPVRRLMPEAVETLVRQHPAAAAS